MTHATASRSRVSRTGYILEDGEARHRAHPRSFQIPEREIRDNLLAPAERGLVPLAKLIFTPTSRRGGDRMWVEVKSKTGATYVGTLRNEPTEPDLGLAFGSEIRFQAKHVVDVDIEGKPSLMARVAEFFRSW